MRWKLWNDLKRGRRANCNPENALILDTEGVFPPFEIENVEVIFPVQLQNAMKERTDRYRSLLLVSRASGGAAGVMETQGKERERRF